MSDPVSNADPASNADPTDPARAELARADPVGCPAIALLSVTMKRELDFSFAVILPDGSRIAGIRNGHLHVVELRDGGGWSREIYPTTICASECGRYVVAAHFGLGELSTWDVATGERIAKARHRYINLSLACCDGTLAFDDVVFTIPTLEKSRRPYNHSLALACGDEFRVELEDADLRLYDRVRDRYVFARDVPSKDPSNELLAATTAGGRFVLQCERGNLHVVDLATGAVLDHGPLPDDATVSASANGHHAIVSDHRSTVLYELSWQRDPGAPRDPLARAWRALVRPPIVDVLLERLAATADAHLDRIERLGRNLPEVELAIAARRSAARGFATAALSAGPADRSATNSVGATRGARAATGPHRRRSRCRR